MDEIQTKINFILSLDKIRVRYLDNYEEQDRLQRKYFLNTFWWFADIFESAINLLNETCFYLYPTIQADNHIRLLQLLYVKESLEFFTIAYNSLLASRFSAMNIMLRSNLESLFALLWISFHHKIASWVFGWLSKQEKKFRFTKFLKNDLWLWDNDFWYAWKSFHAHWNAVKVSMEFSEITTWKLSQDKDYIKIWIEWWMNQLGFQMWGMLYFLRTYFFKEDMNYWTIDDTTRWIICTLDVLEELLVWAKRKNSNNVYVEYMELFKKSLKIAKEKECL